MKRTSLARILAGAAVVALATAAHASHITWTKWTFEPGTPGNPPSGFGSNINNISPAIGSGVASGHHTSNATTWDNPNGNGSNESFNSNSWSAGNWYQFRTSTLGVRHIELSWDQTRSANGPSAFELQYSTDGTNFTPHMSYNVPQIAWSNAIPNPLSSFSADLTSVTSLNNQANVYFRLVATAGGAPGAVSRVDNFTVHIPEPASVALMLLATFGIFGLRRRHVH
jgi:hypothetical protein